MLTVLSKVEGQDFQDCYYFVFLISLMGMRKINPHNAEEENTYFIQIMDTYNL
jgi:hypothetical protein